MTSIIHDFRSIARKMNRLEQKADWDAKNPPPPKIGLPAWLNGGLYGSGYYIAPESDPA